MTSTASAIEIGGALGRYRVERLLGRGRTGIVYLATHAESGRRVALKVVAPEIAGAPGFRERFLGDCELVAGLDHPSVLPVYEAGEADGALYVAMQHVEGADLGSMLRDGPLSEEQTAAIVEQVAGALHAAHCCGLVHRDVKPSNIFLEASTHQVYVSDFGLPGPADGFASPERIEGKRLDGRADVYSLGCVLAACLAGRPQRGVERVAARARATDPSERYTTTVELAEAFHRAVASQAATEPTLPFLSDDVLLALPKPSRSRRRKLILACTALVLVGGVAAGLAALLGGGGHGRAAPPLRVGIGATLAPVERVLARVAVLGARPVTAPPLYDVVANSGGVGVRYRSSPEHWCGSLPQTGPCGRDVVPGAGAAEGQQLRVYCYVAGASVHGDTWWAKVRVKPDEYVPTVFLGSASRYSSIAPPASLRC